MFRQTDEARYEEHSAGGTRHLFALDHFQFRDVLDDDGGLHPYVIELPADAEEEAGYYETDAGTMYEVMARYLAGVYEVVEYDLEDSPAHDALLDLLELACARARSGDGDFALDELEGAYEDEVEEESDESSF